MSGSRWTSTRVAPVVLCDARDRDSVKNVLITLVRQVLAQTSPAAEYQSAPLPAG